MYLKNKRYSEYSSEELKEHYKYLFEVLEAEVENDNFINYIKQVVDNNSWELRIDKKLLNDFYEDKEVLKYKKYGALESLRKILTPLAESANYKTIYHPDWQLLAGRLEVLKLKLEVPEKLKEMINKKSNIWDKDYYEYVKENTKRLEKIIVNERDYDFYYFGIKTLEKSYLMRLIDDNQFLETPQRMYLRIAIYLWMPNIDMIEVYYHLLSKGLISHASPTMFHSGVKKGSLASCFLLTMQDDLEKIFKCLGQCAMISKSAGGIGLDVTNIRHSSVGNFGKSSGLVPMLKVYDSSMRYVDQAGRRKGSATIFLQPWHLDFPDFIELRRPGGVEEKRARDLFYSVWNCDLFMKRIRDDKSWTLFCPKYAPKLKDTYGEEFEKWYHYYERELPKLENHNTFMKTVDARKLWEELLSTQIETGMPFMTNKDTVNYTNNQKNLGLIRSSNLCQEIMEVTEEDTISSCNLASLALDEYVCYNDEKIPYFNFTKLGNTVKLVVRALNNVIDRTYYPLEKKSENSYTNILGSSYLAQATNYIISTFYNSSYNNNNPSYGPIKNTNLKYRPLGIGVQALADTFLKLDLSWEDPEAKKLNRDIFATIYYYALDESVELSKKYGPYDGFFNSPASKGLLKPDLIAMENARKKLDKLNISSSDSNYDELMESYTKKYIDENLSPLYDWNSLRLKVQKYGIRNSLLVALMPTASSAQIRYKNESFEPFTSNLYSRNVLAGTYIIINKYLVDDLISLDLWNDDMMTFLQLNEGSVQNLNLDNYPEHIVPKIIHLKDKYKTAYELSQKLIVDLSIDRSYYVCQSQSLNIHLKNPDHNILNKLHFYAWEKGLSTGMYYLRSKAAVQAVKYSLDNKQNNNNHKNKKFVCTDDICISCQS